MTPLQAITFIRDTLGCRCPEELFRGIRNEVDLTEGPLFAAFTSVEPGLVHYLDRVLAVGGRLLVAVTRVSDSKTVSRMLEAGRVVRDSQGFNRFRLVVMVPVDRQPVEKTVPAHFDDRIHLHILDMISARDLV
ncbi:MAG: hypothetical protein P1S46_05360 [bacterium]|nr:hypothetical protein [bacterium]